MVGVIKKWILMWIYKSIVVGLFCFLVLNIRWIGFVGYFC